MMARKWFCMVSLALAFLAAVPLHLCAETGTTREYQVKGAFLYKFILFISWPAVAFATDESHFTIGVLGNNPFGSTLESLRGQNVKNRKLSVRHLAKVEDAVDCQIVFISVSERCRLRQILTALHKTPVLTVSDIDGFARAGGMIRLISIEDKIRFEINLKETQAANIRISSQLLKLAHNVIE